MRSTWSFCSEYLNSVGSAVGSHQIDEDFEGLIRQNLKKARIEAREEEIFNMVQDFRDVKHQFGESISKLLDNFVFMVPSSEQNVQLKR